MAYSIDDNYKDINLDVNQYLNEQNKLKQDMKKSSLGDSNNISLMAKEYDLLATQNDRVDAFNQMADDYQDGKMINSIEESRRRDPLNQAIDERNDRVQGAMQDGKYVDTRDKNFLYHTNPQQYEQARVQGEISNQSVMNDTKITELNQQKDLQLNQAELDIINQLTAKNEYGQERQQSPEELRALKEKMEIIQNMKSNTDIESHIEKPHVMSTEELMANQIKLQQLHQQLNGEYQDINNNLSGRSR